MLKSNLCDGLELRVYFKTVYFIWFLPRTNLYYLFMYFYHSNLHIFINIAFFPFFNPLQLHFVPKFHLCDGLELKLFFRIVYLTWFLPPTNLYHLLMQFWHSNLSIFINLAFPFSPHFSSILCLNPTFLMTWSYKFTSKQYILLGFCLLRSCIT